ncbi:unnamed protein product, partial [Mesorhabditis belari]|uniref:Acylamino-acid-releasing enzyme N-terminal domain-containing protein n=1 Tax=Mesorhabditis belari TaxID=2138241 RepID=A0AAF3F5K3_9BILA
MEAIREEIVGIVNEASIQDNEFPGLFLIQKTQKPVFQNGRRIVFGSAWHSKTEILIVDVVEKKLIRLANLGEQIHGSWSLLDRDQTWCSLLLQLRIDHIRHFSARFRQAARKIR